MSGRHDILEIIGRPGAAVQTFVGRIVFGFIRTLITGLEPLSNLFRRARAVARPSLHLYSEDLKRLLHAYYRYPAIRWALVFAAVLIGAYLLVRPGFPEFGRGSLINWEKYGGSAEDFRNLLWGITIPLAAVAAVIGLFLTGIRTAALTRQVKTDQEGLITERYSRSVELLGHEKRSVRTGAVYALERLAKDSPADHITIVEVLAAYIRESAQRTDSDPIPEETVIRPYEDIFAALTVISRRQRQPFITTYFHSGSVSAQHVDLRYTDLTGLDMPSARFESTNFSYAILTDARLLEADLRHSQFYRANFHRANLNEADLSRARGSGSNWKRAWLSGASLVGTDFTGADFSEAMFFHANLSGANLAGSNFLNATFAAADLARTTVHDANFTGARFSRAKNLVQEQLNTVLFDPDNPPSDLPEGLKLPDMSEAWANSIWAKE